MPRPSLKEQRSYEILDAFLTCVAKYGLEGATQERIAAEAGVKRTLLRHYLGNRDEMIKALIDYVVNQFDALTEALRVALPTDNSIDALLKLLFSANSQSDPRLTVVFQALVAASNEYTEIRPLLLDSMTKFIDLVDDELRRAYPKKSKRDRQAIAHGIVGIYLTHDALHPLTPPNSWRQSSQRAAQLLLAALKDN